MFIKEKKVQWDKPHSILLSPSQDKEARILLLQAVGKGNGSQRSLGKEIRLFG
jgi:hypothetical protein